MAKIVLYFGKFNLISGPLFEVYNGKTKMHDIMLNVLLSIQDGISYEKEVKFKPDDGEEVLKEEIIYKISIREKTDTYVQGYLYKNSKIYFKNFNEATKQFVTKSVRNDEGVEFYFDVFSEMVGYYTANRLGHKEFREAFCNVINKAVEKYDYEFELKPYTKGLSLDEIKNDLKSMGALKSITIKYHIPNPGEEMLKKIAQDGEGIENFKKANLAKKSVLLTSANKQGINVDSEEVNKELNQIESIHSSMDAKTATKNAYVQIDATSFSGINMSTLQKRPVKREIGNIIEFAEACAEVIKRRKS